MASSVILKSMTAYGRATQAFVGGTLHIEMQCVNRRFLDVSLTFPKSFQRFENDARRWIGQKIARGQVSVALIFNPNVSQEEPIEPNISRAKGLKLCIEKLAEELDVPLNKETLLPLLLQNAELLTFDDEPQDEAAIKEALFAAIDEALEKALIMRSDEGELLRQDISNRVKTLGVLIEKIQQLAPNAAQKYREKIALRVKELFSQYEEIEDKVLKEAALYADRVDITEEMIRFTSHLSQLNGLLTQPQTSELETRGKRLEFLVQELGREINTASSKAQDAAISMSVVEIKAELEKIKEQAQNVE